MFPMSDVLVTIFDLMLYLFEGYCIQFLFRSFVVPRLLNWKLNKYMVGVAWIVIRMSGSVLFPDVNGISLIGKMLFHIIVMI
jgi:hypothetical protein